MPERRRKRDGQRREPARSHQNKGAGEKSIRKQAGRLFQSDVMKHRMSTGSLKRVFLLAGLSLLLLWGIGLVPAAAEERPETLTGYFPERAYVRPEMIQTTEYAAAIPACTVVTLKRVDETWAEYTSPEGITGYVRYAKLLPVPEYERDPEKYVYGEKHVEVRNLPVYDSRVIYTAKPMELLTVDGHFKGFRHVRTEDGTEGYLLPYGVKDAVFTPKPISPVTLCVGQETELLDLPLRGAHPAGQMQPDRFYTADGTSGDYYALKLDGTWVYAEKKSVTICAWKGGEDRIFFTIPKAGRASRKNEIRTIFLPGLAKEGAELIQPDGSGIPLEKDEQIYVCTGFGGWLGAVRGTDAGYIRADQAILLEGDALMERLRETDLSGGRIARNELLDWGLTMVERGNPFQARYNLLTGARCESLLPLGIPYFWGGRNYGAVTERLPEYTTREAWQSSPVFYQQGTIYLYGFDCIGLVKSVYRLAGKEVSGTLTGRRAPEYCAAGEHIYCDDAHPLPEDWREAAKEMRVGDIMIIHHPGTHAMMYMGTLRDYGYTEEQLPALRDYLDYPLMLQAGANPYSYLRFQSLIESSGDARTASASPPDGSVCVCILGVPREKAEIVMECHDEIYYGFEVESSCVTIMSFGNVTDYFVYRPGAAEPFPGVPENPVAEDETEAAGDNESGLQEPGGNDPFQPEGELR